jgi:hypothetical protein
VDYLKTELICTIDKLLATRTHQSHFILFCMQQQHTRRENRAETTEVEVFRETS